MSALSAQAPADPPTLPATQTTALDGHTVMLPRDLGHRFTVLIIGFGRHSAGATTAWERPVRTQLAHAPESTFYDIAMLAEVPAFVRPVVIRSIRHEVPDALRPNFLPLIAGEDQWKRVAAYSAQQPDAPYVLLVDASGAVRWASHSAFSPNAFQQLKDAADQITSDSY